MVKDAQLDTKEKQSVENTKKKLTNQGFKSSRKHYIFACITQAIAPCKSRTQTSHDQEVVSSLQLQLQGRI